MAAGGYRADLGCLRSGARGLRDLSDQLRQSAREPLAPAPGSNEGFTSTSVLIATADAWTAEAVDIATTLRAAGDALAQSATEYHRADVASAQDFHRILRGG